MIKKLISIKRIIMVSLLILVSIGTGITQDLGAEWDRLQDIEEYFSLFEVEVEVWHNEYLGTINFEDDFSKDFDEMLFQWGYLMTAFEFMLEDSGMIFEDTMLEVMVYSFFYVVDPRVDKYTDPNMRYDVYMEREWSIEYFQVSRRERQEMLYDLFDEHYMSWFPGKRSAN